MSTMDIVNSAIAAANATTEASKKPKTTNTPDLSGVMDESGGLIISGDQKTETNPNITYTEDGGIVNNTPSLTGAAATIAGTAMQSAEIAASGTKEKQKEARQNEEAKQQEADASTGDDGVTEGEVVAQEQETDSRIQDAFLKAAEQLGLSIGISGGYVFLNEECPPETDEALKKVSAECAVQAGQNNQGPTQTVDENGDIVDEVDTKQKCAVGGKGFGDFKLDKIPSVNDTIPGTSFKYGIIVQGNSFTSAQGYASRQAALNSIGLNAVRSYAVGLQELTKWMKATGISGRVTGTARTLKYAKRNGWSQTSKHIADNIKTSNDIGAIDFVPNGGAKKAFEKVVEMVKNGSLCGSQFILEIGSSGDIIHFDFSNNGMNRVQVGGTGAATPLYSVSPLTVAALNSTYNQRKRV